MREYRFKAINSKGKWIEFGIECGWGMLLNPIDRDTICEHTGIGDIWEHDIIEHQGRRYEVIYHNGSYRCLDVENSGKKPKSLAYFVDMGAYSIGSKFDRGII